MWFGWTCADESENPNYDPSGHVILIKSPAEGGSDDDDLRTKQQRRTTTAMAGHEARRSFVVREATQRTPENHDGAVAMAKPRSSSARPSETRQRPPSLVQIDRQRLFSSKHFGADLKLMIWGTDLKFLIWGLGFLIWGCGGF
ncbi:hypothetical protein LWI29_036107 [Acer saccharum]|uniref:Uncharacterized protein n=1 Tax=Acer saccharum TaxID=4024 RepID=A0AA39VCU1_ACESA|nr:hypothetical protein LWI29_036107 [Acer saccharum]